MPFNILLRSIERSQSQSICMPIPRRSASKHTTIIPIAKPKKALFSRYLTKNRIKSKICTASDRIIHTCSRSISLFPFKNIDQNNKRHQKNWLIQVIKKEKIILQWIHQLTYPTRDTQRCVHQNRRADYIVSSFFHYDINRTRHYQKNCKKRTIHFTFPFLP